MNDELREKYGPVFRALGRTSRSECPSAEVLVGYVEEELDDRARTILEEHLDTCPHCLHALTRLRDVKRAAEEAAPPDAVWQKAARTMDAKVYDFLETLKSQPAGSAAESDKEKWWVFLSKIRLAVLRPQFAFAVLLLSLTLGGIYTYALLSRPSYFALALPDAMAVGTVRGAAAAAGDLHEGLTAFERGDYAVAVRHLRRLVEQDPENYAAHFYLGVATLFQARVRLLGLPYSFDAEKVRQAIAHLQRARILAGDNFFYQEDCLWYLSKARLMLNDVSGARQFLQQLVALPHPGLTRREAAKRVLVALNPLPEARE